MNVNVCKQRNRALSVHLPHEPALMVWNLVVCSVPDTVDNDLGYVMSDTFEQAWLYSSPRTQGQAIILEQDIPGRSFGKVYKQRNILRPI